MPEVAPIGRADRWLRIVLALNGRYTPDPDARDAFAVLGLLAFLVIGAVLVGLLVRSC